jgi:hypothetical protein
LRDDSFGSGHGVQLPLGRSNIDAGDAHALLPGVLSGEDGNGAPGDAECARQQGDELGVGCSVDGWRAKAHEQRVTT